MWVIGNEQGWPNRIFSAQTFLRLVSTEISKHYAFADNIEIKCLSVHFNSF